jgi:hypothetical protein
MMSEYYFAFMVAGHEILTCLPHINNWQLPEVSSQDWNKMQLPVRLLAS